MATGNVILFSRESDAAPCIADPLTKKPRAIDTYRFVCIFPYLTSRSVLDDKKRSVDLVMWRSQAFPSRTQILSITNATERSNVVKDLYNRFGYDLAWDPFQPASTAFFALNASGAMAATATSSPKIEEDLSISDRGRLVYADVQLAETDASSPLCRSLLTTDDPGAWTPHGLEVKVAGEAGRRRLWVRLTAETQAGAQRTAASPLTLVVSIEDS